MQGERERARDKCERVCGGEEPWTHREADAHGGGEGPWDELALVELNQQRSLSRPAVSHQDGLQRESQIEGRHHVLQPSPEALTLRRGSRDVFICCSVHSSLFCDAS